MAAQRKNLLEAFRSAGDVPASGKQASKRPDPPAERERPSPERERPSTERERPSTERARPSLLEKLKERRARAAAATSAGAAREGRRSSALEPGARAELPPVVRYAAVAGVSLAIGIALGRASMPDVAQAGESPMSPLDELHAEGPELQGAGLVPGGRARNLGTQGTRDTLDAHLPRTGTTEKPRIEDSPLFDSANHYTIVVQTYNQSSSDHAWATFEHLRAEGFSVFPPVVKDEYLLILVGAAPRSNDLAPIEERIRELLRDGEPAYHDAYRVKIDDYIDR